MKRTKLTPNQLILLRLLYEKDLDNIIDIFGKKEALDIRNTLLDTDYILSDNNRFTDTVISVKNVEKLFGIRGDKINFWEFYNCYPVKVGARVLRASGATSQLALKHQKKYLNRVKTKDAHENAIKAVESFVAKQKQANKLMYLPNMETVMNNSMWEQWQVFVQANGVEEQEWNSDLI